MKMKSIVRRAGITIPFLVVAALVLNFFSHPTRSVRPGPDVTPGSFLIVTTESLEPAFEAFRSWNHQMGCDTGIILLPRAGSRDRAKSNLAYLGALCRLRGATGLLLGGDDQQVPVRPDREFFLETAGTRLRGLAMPPRLVPIPTPPRGVLPEGLRVGRAPVSDLPEAWAFVEACRATGLTLDRLMRGDASPSMAMLKSAAVRGERGWTPPGEEMPAYPAVAGR